MKGKAFCFCVLVLCLLFSGCAPLGPSVVKSYPEMSARDRIAILRLDACRKLTVTGYDGQQFMRGAKYLLLRPGRHEVYFLIVTSTLWATHTITNRKYIDVLPGRTYILASKGAGILTLGDKWYPDLLDVTGDPKLHLRTIPQERNLR